MIVSLISRSFGGLWPCMPFWVVQAKQKQGRWNLSELRLRTSGLNKLIVTHFRVVNEVNITVRVR